MSGCCQVFVGVGTVFDAPPIVYFLGVGTVYDAPPIVYFLLFPCAILVEYVEVVT